MARVKPEVGNGPLPRSLTGPNTSTRFRVVVVEPQVARPSDGGPTTDQGISSAIQIRDSVIELSGQVKKQAVKVLIDSGATINFISDDLVAAWDLPIELESQDQELKLADGSIVQPTGRVQFNLLCGNYRSRIIDRVFPNLHMELTLEIP